MIKSDSSVGPMTTSDSTVAQQIAQAAIAFEQRRTGHAPKSVAVVLSGDTLVITLHGALSPAEKGRDLLKQVRTHLIETARPVMEAMVEGATGVAVVSLHHDISTATGEEVVVFTLAEPPGVRDAKKR